MFKACFRNNMYMFVYMLVTTQLVSGFARFLIWWFVCLFVCFLFASSCLFVFAFFVFQVIPSSAPSFFHSNDSYSFSFACCVSLLIIDSLHFFAFYFSSFCLFMVFLFFVFAFSFCSVLSKSVLVPFFAHSHACSKDTAVYTCFQASWASKRMELRCE